MFKYIFLVFIMLFIGCSSTNNNIIIEDKKEESFITTKKYMNISKDAIFEAAKKVFILAGQKEFRIDSYRDKLLVSKTKMNAYPFYAVTIEDRWLLSIEEKNNLSTAKLNIFRITDYNEENQEQLSSSLHELLWNRIDYLLGLTDNWISCEEHYAYLNFTNAICDTLDMPKPKSAKKDDIIKDILILDREKSKSLKEIDNDILKDDIVFSIDDTNTDILEKEDKIDKNVKRDKTLDDLLDKEIEELDKKVNSNIDKTLNKIEENLEDEPTLNIE